MATLSLLRAAGAARLSRVAGPALLRHTPSTSVIAKKTFVVSQVRQKRIYGPDEGLPSVTSHWKQERAVMLLLYPIIPAAIFFPHPVLDYALAASVVLHAHWGLSGVAQDYIHGPTIYPLAKYTVLVASILSFGGMCYLNQNDMGFGHAVKFIFTQL